MPWEEAGLPIDDPNGVIEFPEVFKHDGVVLNLEQALSVFIKSLRCLILINGNRDVNDEKESRHDE